MLFRKELGGRKGLRSKCKLNVSQQSIPDRKWGKLYITNWKETFCCSKSCQGPYESNMHSSDVFILKKDAKNLSPEKDYQINYSGESMASHKI